MKTKALKSLSIAMLSVLAMACSPALERDPAVLAADLFLESLSAQKDEQAKRLTLPNSESEASIPYLSQVFFLKKSMDSIRVISFDPVKVDHGEAHSEVVFNQMLDGQVAVDNITVVLKSVNKERTNWKVVDVKTR